jgi:adenosylmethionine-8-amino-7-oxononanoate aminotransferase
MLEFLQDACELEDFLRIWRNHYDASADQWLGIPLNIPILGWRRTPMTIVFARDLRTQPPVIVRGEGVYLYADNGRRYLDGCAGALVANIGHGVTEIGEAMAAQARRIAYTHLSTFITEPAVRLAQCLIERAPRGLTAVHYASGGSEAVEAALKLSRAYFVERDGLSSGKHLIIGRWIGYHGSTLGALSAGGHVLRRQPYLDMLIPSGHIEPCNAYRHPFAADCADWDVRLAEQLEAAILREGPSRVAAFIAEPVVGAASGAVPGTRGYFRTVREICDRHDVLFIADEVMCGFGRTGAQFAVEHFGVIPDLLVMGKGMAAGYAPLGGLLVHGKILEVFQKGSGRFIHGHTYSAHPSSCAAGYAVQRYMDDHGLVQRAAAMGAVLERKLRALRGHQIVGDVRGMGMMWGIEFVRDRVRREPFAGSLHVADQIAHETMERGVVVYPGAGCADGVNGDHILIGPPLTITESEIDELVTGIDGAIKAVASRLTVAAR